MNHILDALGDGFYCFSLGRSIAGTRGRLFIHASTPETNSFHIPQNLLPRKPANNHLKMYLLLKMVFVFFNVMLVFSNFSSHQKVRNRYRLVVIPVPSMAVRGKLISLAVIQPLGFLIQVEANNYQLPSLQTNMTRWWFQLDGGSNPWPMTRFKTCFYIYCLGGGNSNIF